jgi:N-glycosylase/DNA lyase
MSARSYPHYSEEAVSELIRLYKGAKEEITARLAEFKRTDDDGVFLEMCFCLFTPQSKAKNCWAAVERLKESGLIYRVDANAIAKDLEGVRFHNHKAGYLVSARKKVWTSGVCHLSEQIRRFPSAFDAREWLVKNIKGMGYKEASHFLRNIGHGSDLAILDRHILKNLKNLGVIKDVPRSLNRSRYLEIERELLKFSEYVKIPPDHLDLLLWYKEAGEVFK